MFKMAMKLQVFLYRLTGGMMGGNMRGFNVLLLTTRGRKSGKQRTTPLGHFDRDGGYVIVASNGGRDSNPAWYYNLKGNPQVKIQVLNKRMTATAEELSGDARAKAWQQVITEAPFYANYEKRTARHIPLILLRPGK